VSAAMGLPMHNYLQSLLFWPTWLAYPFKAFATTWCHAGTPAQTT
jgi:hypothetical protein